MLMFLKDRRMIIVSKFVMVLSRMPPAFYYAFGDYDVVDFVDIPDNVSAAAFSMMVNASGMINAKTAVLLAPEDIDQATSMVVDYRPPRQ